MCVLQGLYAMSMNCMEAAEAQFKTALEANKVSRYSLSFKIHWSSIWISVISLHGQKMGFFMLKVMHKLFNGIVSYLECLQDGMVALRGKIFIVVPYLSNF